MKGVDRAVSRISRWLTDLYALEFDFHFDAGHFVMDAERAQEILPGSGPRTGVLVVEERGALSLGLYVDERDAGDLGTLVEETSHLVCVAWHGARELPVSQLLLEIQGDIDRFLFRRLAPALGPVADPFGGFHWVEGLDAVACRRYRAAHRAARRYCSTLDRRFPRRSDTPALLEELRSFYRASPDARLRWAQAG